MTYNQNQESSKFDVIDNDEDCYVQFCIALLSLQLKIDNTLFITKWNYFQALI